MVTFTESTISTTQDNLARRAERHAEAQERPRWATDVTWQAATAEARTLGYTGRGLYARAAELLADRYGYYR